MPEPKLPDIMAEIRALRGKVQELETILTEQGVELEPRTPTSLKVKPGISRVWATLWGRDKTSLRIVGVDRIGQLIVRPVSCENCIAVYKSGTTDGAGYLTIDMGRIVDFAAIRVLTAGYVKVWFGMKEGGWEHGRHLIQSGSGGVNPTSIGEYFQRFRWLRVNIAAGAGAEQVGVEGEVFPEQ